MALPKVNGPGTAAGQGAGKARTLVRLYHIPRTIERRVGRFSRPTTT